MKKLSPLIFIALFALTACSQSGSHSTSSDTYSTTPTSDYTATPQTTAIVPLKTETPKTETVKVDTETTLPKVVPVPRESPAPTPVANKNCTIKGNISQTTGERIYHVPGGQYYSKTSIDESAGERWFCSETEARQAGWRKSKR